MLHRRIHISECVRPLQAGGEFNYHGSSRIAVKLHLLDPSHATDLFQSIRSDSSFASFEIRPNVSDSIVTTNFGAGSTSIALNDARGLEVPASTSGVTQLGDPPLLL